MAWELVKVEDQRRELVKTYLEGKTSMTELCKIYRVSRKTAYKWCNRYLNEPEETFKDLSRARRRSSTIYGDELIERMINLKLKRRKWGPKKILWELEKIYPEINWPSKTRLTQAQHFTASIPYEEYQHALVKFQACNAFLEPNEGKLIIP